MDLIRISNSLAGATWISFKLMFWRPMHVPERLWAITKLNGLIEELICLIHEVLDRQKAMGLDEAFIKTEKTMDQHGRLVGNLIDQEMDGKKLIGQEMERAIQCDREMDCNSPLFTWSSSSTFSYLSRTLLE
ncbi:hypothetical protein F2Q69_00030527 [Brassica cretica]|uniref:Uncharacterized protein n=1 Tax=Brassica cretica TaxID=69181 RepID=A0A8S9RX59_BRACR|nr:hypothetical protein F2Q69_00030527 [Brassica cretica]